MANPNRLAKRYLRDLTKNPEELYEHNLVSLLRYLDANSPLNERLGHSVSPKQDHIRLGQEPILHFHSSDYVSIEYKEINDTFKVKNSYWGMLGINGPLPNHLTEYAIERKTRQKDHTFAEFLDVFNHRFLSLFYRAWAESQPTVSQDRLEKDRFQLMINSLAGKRNMQACPSDFKAIHAFAAGLLSQKSRSASILAQTLSEYLGKQVRVSEFEGAWYPLQENEQTQLGRVNASLGLDCMLGESTFQRSFKFSVIIGPLSYIDYIQLLGNKDLIKTLKSIIQQSVGLENDFTIKLLLKPKQTQPAFLGAGKLGINSWCQDKQAANMQISEEIVYELEN